ncbi:hypothetical protein BB559_001692 [Furculomyces boomerangus]|uniref:Myb-like domain-containing protein n=1 Tax=Furculomyces boomerangus TaxID=61424 RepID=A0A2T9Z119_9FUNG|nr:hypothetical protein BB559_001692 [Furculomyces boomerangus]
MIQAKPRSMPTGARNVVRSNDSASLWNCTLSPGWTKDEVEILRNALIKFGIGNWTKIIESDCLLGKTIAQMNLQTQRMLGQQSTAEFSGLHIDPFVIGQINSLKDGPDIKRKNGFIINTENKLTREQIAARREENRIKYQADQQQIDQIVLPKATAKPTLLDEKRKLLADLESQLAQVRQKINNLNQKPL